MEYANTIKTLFGSRDVCFEIPSYQRAYAWEKKHCAQFIEDLRECKGNNYYLGHFLFEKGGEKLFVIDGQQRLTTCVVFFSAWVETMKRREQEWIGLEQADAIGNYIDDIVDYYLKDIRRKKQKFYTVAYDNNFFADAVIDRKDYTKESLTSKSRYAIHDALVFFRQECEKASIEELLMWGGTLEEASITTYIVEDKLQAAQIFAYQNDRGKKLTDLERLKSYLMLQMYRLDDGEDSIKYIENAFEEIYHNIVLLSAEEDEVLNYYWRAISKEGYYSRKMISEFKAWLSTVAKEEISSCIKKFVSDLSKAFQIVHQIEQDNSFDLSNLKNLNNPALAYPMLIKARLAGVGEKGYQRLVRLLENLTFRYLIRGGRADLRSRLQSVLSQIRDEEHINSMIDNVVNKLRNDWWWGYWSDSQMMEQLNSGWFYGNRVDNYLLWRYEQYLCSANYPATKVMYSDVISNESIEHIAPQTECSVQNSGYGKYTDEENYREGIVSGEWMNCIGNLMLMAKSQNSSLGNRPFADKLKVYGSDNLLNQQKEIIDFVADKDNPVWDKAAIECRFNKIIQAAQEIWSLDKI